MNKQKLIGLGLVALGLVSVPLLGHDATVAIAAIPAGLCLMFMKSNSYEDEEEE